MGFLVWELVRMNKHCCPQAASLLSQWIKWTWITSHLRSFPIKVSPSRHQLSFWSHYKRLFLILSALCNVSFFFHVWTRCCCPSCHLPQKSRRYRPLRNSCPSMSLPLTKSVSMLAISQRDIDGEWLLRMVLLLLESLHRSKTSLDHFLWTNRGSFYGGSFKCTGMILFFHLISNEQSPKDQV